MLVLGAEIIYEVSQVAEPSDTGIKLRLQDKNISVFKGPLTVFKGDNVSTYL